MEIITFFSFKGGVGRTQALLNTACEFAQRGRKVLLLDFDLHAPGLSLMECMRPLKPTAEPRPGVLDFFEWLVLLDDAVRRGEEVPAPINLAACAFEPVISQNLREGSGFLKIVPASRFADEGGEATGYSDRVHAIDSQLTEAIRRTHRNSQTNPVIEQIRSQFAALPEEEQPDAIFIDARTGITVIADLLLTRSSDRIVLVTGLNQQNLWGLEATLQDIERAVETPDWLRRITIVVSPVPQGELQLTGERIRVITETLDRHVDPAEREMFGVTIQQAPEPVKVPYDAQLVLLEDPILLRYPEAEPSKAYKDLADRLGTKMDPLQFRLPDSDRFIAQTSALLPQEHPLSRMLPWNSALSAEQTRKILGQFVPAQSPDKPYAGWLNHLLNYVANTLMGMEKKEGQFSGLLKPIRGLTLPSRTTFIEALRGIRRSLLSLPHSEWPRLARTLGESRVFWEAEMKDRLGGEVLPWKSLVSDSTSASQWGGYWTGMADALRMIGDREAAVALLVEGARRFNGRPDFAWEASHLLLMADAYEEALAVADAWVVFAITHKHSSLVDALVRKGDILKLVSKVDEAHNTLNEAEQLAREAGKPLGLANTLRSLGGLLTRTDQLDEARARYDEALPIYREAKDRLGEANTLRSLGDLLTRTDQLDEARARYDEALPIYREAKARLGEANTLQGLAKWHLAKGDLAECQEVMEDCLERYTALEDSEGRWETQLVSARLDAARDAHQAALETAGGVAKEAHAAGHLLIARDAEELMAGWNRQTPNAGKKAPRRTGEKGS